MKAKELFDKFQISDYDGEILLKHIINGTNKLPFGVNEDISELKMNELSHLCERRQKGEPIATIIGSVVFFGLQLKTSKEVMVPRSSTEKLVTAIVDLSNEIIGTPVILELGTGIGAASIAIAESIHCDITATDISKDAIETSLININRFGNKVKLINSDWFESIPNTAKYNIIFSNPPFVPGDHPILSGYDDLGSLQMQPLSAITDYSDGFKHIKKIISGAKNNLTDKGWLVFQHWEEQKEKCADLLEDGGYKCIKQIIAEDTIISLGRIN